MSYFLICKNCGEIISESNGVCQKCGTRNISNDGFPIPSHEDPTLKDNTNNNFFQETKSVADVNQVGNNIKKWKVAFFFSLLLMIVSWGVTIFVWYSNKSGKAGNQKEEKSRDSLEEEVKQLSEQEYEEILKDACEKLWWCVGYAEERCSAAKEVWYNATYKIKDQKTDEFTMKDGKFYDNPFEALRVYQGFVFTKSSTIILDNAKDSVVVMLKELSNPPPKWEAVYKMLLKFYNEYCDLHELATNPMGKSSLVGFIEDYEKLYSQLSEKAGELRLYIDF